MCPCTAYYTDNKHQLIKRIFKRIGISIYSLNLYFFVKQKSTAVNSGAFKNKVKVVNLINQKKLTLLVLLEALSVQQIQHFLLDQGVQMPTQHPTLSGG